MRKEEKEEKEIERKDRLRKVIEGRKNGRKSRGLRKRGVCDGKILEERQGGKRRWNESGERGRGRGGMGNIGKERKRSEENVKKDSERDRKA
jgi:hypothetical protein